MTSQVRAALAAADLRTLINCLVHLTGEEKWLGPRYRPVRDVNLIADPSSGLSAEVQTEIRQAAEDILTGDIAAPAIDDPGPELFGRMMSHCLGEEVPAEYIPVVRADFGFDDSPRGVRRTDIAFYDVVIVGAGVFGVCLAAKLEERGVPYTVLERNAEVGGTWFQNRYPGCGVDTPNHFYSYSFHPNPHWRYYFSPRDELQAYVAESATEFRIRDHVQFETSLLSARWSESDNRWHLVAQGPGGQDSRLSARVLVSAIGHFVSPHEIDLPGSERFAGQIFHTAKWPKDINLDNKRVGVIGTGASAAQVVPSIVDQVSSLVVFQRTPQWVRPIAEYKQPVDAAAQWLFEQVPYYGKWYRFTQFWRYGDGLLHTLYRDPSWPTPDISLNRRNDRHREELTGYIKEQLRERPDLLAKCLPSYPVFGKRILIDSGWYASLIRPHVELVTDSIQGLEETGVRLADGELHELDVLVLATGFKVANVAESIEIQGRGGVLLSEDWENENPTAYLGMTVPRFPNFFVMYGPNTNMGHGGSGMWLAETQAGYIAACIEQMAERNIETIEVRGNVRAAYTAKVDKLHESLIWTHPNITTYYRNRYGQVRSPMPFRIVDYWLMTHEPNFDEFHVSERRRAIPVS